MGLMPFSTVDSSGAFGASELVTRKKSGEVSLTRKVPKLIQRDFLSAHFRPTQQELVAFTKCLSMQTDV